MINNIILYENRNKIYQYAWRAYQYIISVVAFGGCSLGTSGGISVFDVSFNLETQQITTTYLKQYSYYQVLNLTESQKLELYGKAYISSYTTTYPIYNGRVDCIGKISGSYIETITKSIEKDVLGFVVSDNINDYISGEGTIKYELIS